MRWNHRLQGWAFFSLPFIVLAIASTIYLVNLADYLSPRLAPIVAQIAAESIGRQVRISKVTPFERDGYVNLSGIEISNSPKFVTDHGAPAINVKFLEVKYDLPYLLSHPTNAVGAITLVKLDSPTVYIERFKSGSYNFSNILNGKGSSTGHPFLGVVTISDGDLVVKDDNAPTAILRVPHSLTNVAARIDFSSPRVFSFSLQANGDPRYIHSLLIHGQALRGVAPKKEKRATPVFGYGLDIKFVGANLAHFAPYLVPRPSLKAVISSGSGIGEVTIKQVGSPRSALAITGEASIAGATVRLLASTAIVGPISDITGRVQFTQSSATFSGAADLNRQRVAFSGTVLNFHNPQLFVAGDGTTLNYSLLRQSLPSLPLLPPSISTEGPIAAQTWITGSLREPSIDVSAEVPSATAFGYRLGRVETDLTYYRRLLTIHSVNVENGNGGSSLSASGFVDLTNTTPVYHIYGQAHAIDANELPLSEKVRTSLNPIKSSISAIFDVTEAGIDAKLASSDGEVRGVPFEAAEADIFYRPGKSVELRRFFIRQQKSGIMVASGTVPQDINSPNMNLQFSATQIDLSRIGPAFSNASIRGLGYIKGNVTGSVSTPQITSHIFVLQPQFGHYSVNLLTADVSGDAAILKIGRLSVRDVPGSADVTGTITNPISKNPMFDLAVIVNDIPVSYLSALEQATSATSIAQMPVTGFISGSGTVTGSEADPIADASLTIANGTFQDFQLTNSTASIEYRNRIVNIQRVRASVGGIDISGVGAFNPDQETISLDLNATAKDLGPVMHKFAPALQIFGGLQVAASISGNVKNPSVTATVSTQDVSVEGAKLSISPSTFSFVNNRLTMTKGPLAFDVGPAHYTLSAVDVNSSSRTIAMQGSEQGETLAHLISVVQKSPYLESKIGGSLNEVLAKMSAPPSGNLDLSNVTVDGPIDHPTISVTADLTDASIAGQEIDRLHTELSFRSTQARVTAFHLTGPKNVFLDLSGTADTAGPITARLEASGFNLALLDPYLPRHAVADGTLEDLSVVASGETRAPDVSASVSLDKPSYNGLVLDRIDTGEVDIRDEHISVNDLTFTKEESPVGGQTIDHTITAEGSIPFEWKSGSMLKGEIPADVPISLEANIPSQSVDFVNQIDPQFPVKLPAGTVAGHIKVTGTLTNKQINGELSLSNATVLPSGYQTTLKNLNFDVLLNGADFTVRNFTAESNFGGSIAVTGGGKFSNNDELGQTATTASLLSDLQVSLSATANRLTLNEKKIAVFENAGASATISNGVTISGPVLHPLIKGELDLDRVLGSLPQTTATQNVESDAPTFNPRFDITVKIMPEAQIKTAQLNAMADGSMTLEGSLYRPRLDGTFFIRKGQFYFPTATFKVVPIGSVEFHLHPPSLISEVIEMTATTSITVSPDIIARNPAGANTTSTYVPPSVTSTVASSSQRYVVTVDIDGDLETPDRLHLTFQSNPPGLTDAQILAVLGGQEAIAGLTGGNIVSALQTQVASVFNASVVPKILQPLEDSIGTVLGLEDFSIDYAPESPVQVTIVKRIGSRVNVQYTQSVNSRTPGAVSSTLEPPVYQVKVSYSFTPRLQATISTDDQHNEIVAIEGVHNF